MRAFKPYYFSLFLLIASLVSLAVAFIAEYAFGMKPCPLCLYQRLPYAAIAGIAALSLLFTQQGKLLHLLSGLLCGILFLIGAGIAFYHVGVEHHIFAGLTTCSGHEKIAATVEEMRQQLLGTPAVRCDVPAFIFLGISMAGWNMLWSVALGLLTLRLAYKSYQQHF
jgi:disulfide bond formation protein DsbB